jgi:hypothetical protein
MSDRNDLMWSASEDHTICVWKIKGNKVSKKKQLNDHKDIIKCLIQLPDNILDIFLEGKLVFFFHQLFSLKSIGLEMLQ